MKHPDSPVTFYERMQAGKQAKRDQVANPSTAAEKRHFTPQRKAVVPEHKGLLTTIDLPADKPAPVPEAK